MMDLIYVVFLIVFWGPYCSCVNIQFEEKDGSGYFLKQVPRPNFAGENVPDRPDNNPDALRFGTLLSSDRFTVLQTTHPISIRATYGPFNTKQTVPAKYVVPDPFPANSSTSSDLGPIDFGDLQHTDISAHLAQSEIARDSPVLRVLFHAGNDRSITSTRSTRNHRKTPHLQRPPPPKICILVQASLPIANEPPLSSSCSPDGEDGVCLAQMVVPHSWWPPLPTPTREGQPGKVTKTPPRLVKVSYTVVEVNAAQTAADATAICEKAINVGVLQSPMIQLGTVPLVAARGVYKDGKLATDGVFLMVPYPPLYPKSRLHIPVYLDTVKTMNINTIFMRAKVKTGVRLLGIKSSPLLGAAEVPWNLSSVEMNPRQTAASITLNRLPNLRALISGTPLNGAEVVEVFTWLIEVGEDESEPFEGAKIVWTTKSEPHHHSHYGGQKGVVVEPSPRNPRGIENRKTAIRFDILKDDIQAVVPISKNWELLNTAVLTGHQVSQAMKIFIVSQAGKIADVTFQASCHSEDESVLKVSSSCSSVYVDGSEARGSVNASILVKYGTYTGLARFTVWMPEFPLDLQLSDTRLSQIKSWRVPDYHPLVLASGKTTSRYQRRKRSDLLHGNGITDRTVCRLRYQQTRVEVYAHFMASDQDSGRISYLINRRTWLRITDLVLPLLRVSDPRIASLHNRKWLQGRSMGRTEVQVLSPITGRVIGAKEVRISNDKVSVTRLHVQVVAGLQLAIRSDSTIENGYVAETRITHKLTTQYQEGLLDVEMEFSDGTRTPLREVFEGDYHLVVESLNPDVVAFAPMLVSQHPRVIAVNQGTGNLLQISLLLTEDCRNGGGGATKLGSALTTSTVGVSVEFAHPSTTAVPLIIQHRPDILQNDDGHHDLQDILLKGGVVPAKKSTLYAKQFGSGYESSSSSVGRRHTVGGTGLTPLEISMYVLLAAFCCAIVIFVASCVVYASKFQSVQEALPRHGIHASPVVLPHPPAQQPITKPIQQEWVWLGRAPNPDVHITTNPNYCDPPPAHTDDIWNRPTPPPPLPPHGPAFKAATKAVPPPPVPPHRNSNLEVVPDEEIQPVFEFDDSSGTVENEVHIRANALGELPIDMNYQQILEYFENLKESNA